MILSLNPEKRRYAAYILRRLGAYIVDVTLLMVAVQAFQWGLMALTGGFPFAQLTALNNGWLIYNWMLLTVSLPIWLYFILFERSSRQATPGKRLLRLQVTSENGERPSWPQLLARTVLKLLPWEIYHLAFMLPVPLLSDPTPGFRPGFVVGAVVLLLYLLVLVQPPARQSIHDLIARTAVVSNHR